MINQKNKRGRGRPAKVTDKPIFLPPFKVQKVVSSLSETIDWGLKMLNVPETWKITQGEGVIVMVIDSGYSDHSDLADNVLVDKCKTFVKGSSDKTITDFNGHSTHCHGIIAAVQNGMGCIGVAPKAKLIAAKVFDKSGSGSLDSVISALDYAIEVKPDIVSMSLGSPAYDAKMHDRIRKLYAMNIPVIAAAGNDGRDNSVNFPGGYPECICVAAIDENGNVANFSSRGDQVDFAAPGVQIYSTWLDQQYAKLSGTSMATPWIAGLVALLIAKHRKQEAETGKNDCRTVEEIRNHLIKYADDKGAVGRDNSYGYGIIDASKVINELANGNPPKPELPPVAPPVTPPPQKKKSWWRRLLDKLLGNA